MFHTPALFELVDAPREVLLNLHAGEVVLLARLDDEELESVGLDAGFIKGSIDAYEALTPDERAGLHYLWQTARSGDLAWIPAFANLVVEDEGWRDLASLHWCLLNPHFDESYLATGSLGTLANTLLEISSLQATVTDVHAAYSEIAASIASGKLSGTEEGLVVAGNVVVGGVVGWFTAGAGVPVAVKAANWFDEKLRQVDPWVLELALECVVANALEQTRPDVHAAIARKIFAEASGFAARAGGSSSDQQQRMLLNAYRGLMGDATLPGHSRGTPLPDFEGQTVKQAKRYLEASGFASPYFVDAGQPDSLRSIWDDGAWVVRGQRPGPGTPMTRDDPAMGIAYSRPGEVVRPMILAKQLDNAEKDVRG